MDATSASPHPSSDPTAASDGTLPDTTTATHRTDLDDFTQTLDPEPDLTNGATMASPDPAPASLPAAAAAAVPPQQQQQEPPIPLAKDAHLRAFLPKLDAYAPLIPDAVTDHYLTLAGLPPPPQTDRRFARLLALATQKFIADVAADAYQYSRIRSTNTTSNNPLTGLGGAAGYGTAAAGGGADGEGGATGKGGKGAKEGKGAPLGGPRAGFGGGGAGAGQGRTVLTMEDLGMAVGEYGVNVRRGEFYR
ncbi:hypothetical protein LTR53_010704 [Teratosphaeriaceae sp. CCFEE 6253]|nr:hypothetical protein LTR53_010704 [Teratosphaeriaceae sp. CCFEE 6253]